MRTTILLAFVVLLGTTAALFRRVVDESTPVPKAVQPELKTTQPDVDDDEIAKYDEDLLGGIEVGDRVLVTAAEAQLSADFDIVGSVPMWSILLVTDVDGDSFRVVWPGATATVRGWIHRRDVIPFNQALEFVNSEFRQAPTIEFYSARGLILTEMGEYDKALSDYNEVIRLNPSKGYAWFNRGNASYGKGDFYEAIADYDEAIRLDPAFVPAYYNRGRAWLEKGDYKKFIADTDEVIRLNPQNGLAHNNYALVLASCPDDNYRDGKRAVTLATTACELSGWKEAAEIDTLAAAYAEIGDFQNAVKWQKNALDLAPEKETKDFRSRLELYETGKPYRDAPKK